MDFLHRAQADGKWFTRSLEEQLGNVGSEIARAAEWQRTDPKRFELAVARAFELMDLTVADTRWRSSPRFKELCRAREMIRDAYTGGSEYGSTFQNLQPYFDYFAVVARSQSGL